MRQIAASHLPHAADCTARGAHHWGRLSPEGEYFCTSKVSALTHSCFLMHSSKETEEENLLRVKLQKDAEATRLVA